MSSKNKKIYVVGFLILLLILTIIFLYYFYSEKELKVTFCDVGQGDGIFIQTPAGKDILIDGGPDNSILECLGDNMPFYDREIDLVILTHPHADHVVGLVPVLRRYQVGAVLNTGVKSGGPAYREFLNIISAKKIKKITAQSGQVFELGPETELEILFPVVSLENRQVNNSNNSSIVSKLIYQESKFLFMGDLEAEGEKILLLADKDLQADVLKVGHHGSSTSSTQDFLQAVNSDMAVIQCGFDNHHGHPSLRTVNKLQRMGIEVFRNDLDGEITVVSDGEGLGVEIEIKR